METIDFLPDQVGSHLRPIRFRLGLLLFAMKKRFKFAHESLALRKYVMNERRELTDAETGHFALLPTQTTISLALLFSGCWFQVFHVLPLARLRQYRGQ